MGRLANILYVELKQVIPECVCHGRRSLSQLRAKASGNETWPSVVKPLPKQP
jgi:hypothetical protein